MPAATHWIFFTLLTATLAAAAVADWRTGLIPNRLTYTAIGVGIVGWTVAGLVAGGVGNAAQWGGAAVGVALLGFVPGMIIFTLGGLGGGDVKLVAAVGALAADGRLLLAAVVYALIVAVVMAVVIMIRHGIVRRTLQRLAVTAMQLVGRVRPELPGAADSPTVPFGAALAIGGVLAAVEHQLGVAMPWSAYL